MSSETNDLTSVAEAVADGRAVDWEREAGRHTERKSRLRALETVSSVSDFHRLPTLESPRRNGVASTPRTDAEDPRPSVSSRRRRP